MATNIFSCSSGDNQERCGNMPAAQNMPRSRPKKYSDISLDKKEILIKCYQDGETIAEAAKIAGIKNNSAKSIINRYKKNDGVLVEKPRGGRRNGKFNTTLLNKIEQLVEENPSITLKKIREMILDSEHVQLSISSIRNGLKSLRITLKCASLEVDRRNSPRTIEERKEYALYFSQHAPELRQRIIFIDESGFNCHLRRTMARSKINTPARVTVPTVRGRNATLIAAMSVDGILYHEVINYSTVTSNIFCGFLRGLFQKIRDSHLENVWIILDNASIHKTRQVREIVDQERHSLIFLPPYSPMMNPIEEVFSKVKSNAKNILADPSNHYDLLKVINDSVEIITLADCYNYIMNMYVKLPKGAAGEPL